MEYTDSEFVAAVENCTIADFHHRDHIRLALIYLDQYGIPDGTERMLASIRRLSISAGHPEKYNRTVTLAWMRLAAHLLNKSALSAYYSEALLNSPHARMEWVEPDLTPLP